MVADERPAVEFLEERTAQADTGSLLRGAGPVEIDRCEATSEENTPEYSAL